jgi:glycosyltransferase involved in cell wall biosynthesis
VEKEYKRIEGRDVSVVVPVYGGAQTLASLVAELTAVLSASCNRFELILVNDASPDQSWAVIAELAHTNETIRGISLMRNYGQHNALLCGIRSARYGTIITIDDDLQNPPEEIPRLLDKLDEGYDVVYGVPEQEQHGLWRDIASQITKIILSNAMGAETARNVSAFRGFRTQLRDAFQHYQGPFVSIDVLLTWATTRFCMIRVRHNARSKGTSGYTLRRLMTHALNMVTGFSALPLQIASFIGFAFAFMGMIVLAYVVGRYFLQGSPVPGFPFLASIIALFSGAQLFAIGIIGEYLARMHFRTMAQPAYLVRANIGGGE